MPNPIGTASAMSRRELLAKAKELQTPRSFATGVLAGITLYLHGCKDEEVLEMLREGMKFCDLIQRDLEAYQSGVQYIFSPGKGPRYYRPSDIISSQAHVSELKHKVTNIRDMLDNLINEKAVTEERIDECHSLINELLQPYREQATVSLGEFKYGPTLRK